MRLLSGYDDPGMGMIQKNWSITYDQIRKKEYGGDEMLDLVVQGKRDKSMAFEVAKIINAGFSGRNQEASQKHLDEIRKEGINFEVESTPIFFPKLKDRITTGNTVEVLGDCKSCGEAEPVLLIDRDNEIYIGIGSDHSDRELEKHSLVSSKQMCPNVMSRKVWRYADVRDHWDDITMRAWVVGADGKRELYQEGKMQSFMTVEDFLAETKKRVKGDLTGAVIFMGTVPTLNGKLIYTPGFEAELSDERTGKTLNCSYTVTPISWFDDGTGSTHNVKNPVVEEGKPQSDAHSIEDVPWTEMPASTTLATGEGVVEKLLSVDPKNRDNHTRLVKLPKGFRSTKPQQHPFWEEVYMIKGTVVDLGNNVTAKAGSYCCRRPGMLHGPFYCPEEVICFEVHYVPDPKWR